MNITLDRVTFRYKSPASSAEPVLKNISLNIAQGDFLAIIGLSGSGKTTLMQHFTGLLCPDAGRVLADGEDIHAKGFSLSRLRRRIGLVFQFPERQLFAETVFKDVAFGPRNMKLDEQSIARRVAESLASIGLDADTYSERPPWQLSGGEKRRVALAGVLAMAPDCLALDEPTVALDRNGRDSVKRFLREFHHSGKTVVLISHDLELVSEMCSRVAILKEGAIHFDGDVQTLWREKEILKSAGFPMPRTRRLLDFLRERHLLDDRDLAELPVGPSALAGSRTPVPK